MKVCDIVQFHSDLSGGVKRYVLDKIRHLSRQPGTEHIVLIPGPHDRVRQEGATRVYELASPPLLGSRSYRVLTARRRLLRILEDERPDVMEVDGPYLPAWTALAARARLGIPVVGFYHSDYPRALGRTMRRFAGTWAESLVTPCIGTYLRELYNRMDAVVAASSRSLAILQHLGIRRTHHIPLGVDARDFRPVGDPARVRERLGIPADRPLLLYVGRLAREKNIQALLRMMDPARADAGWTLLLVGDGECRRLVQQHVAANPAVRWLPFVTDQRTLSALYTAADLLVHPGTVETFGLVSIEAQVCGTRVVAVRGGGLDDTLLHEARPALAAGASPGQLAAAVRGALAVPETAADRRDRRTRVAELFPASLTFKSLLALYRSLERPPVCDARAGALVPPLSETVTS